MTYVCLIELGQFNAAFPMSDSVGYSFKGLFILFRKVAKETTVSFRFCAVVVCNDWSTVFTLADALIISLHCPFWSFSHPV